MDSTIGCINCLSNNVPLLDMITEIFVLNDVEIKFIDCYKRCTATEVVPLHSRICELCCRQYKSIFNLLCKSQKSKTLPEQHPQIVTVSTPEIDIIKIEDDGFKEELTQFVGHGEIHIECVKAEPIEPVVGTTLTSVDVEETKKRLTLRCCYCPETFSWLSDMQKHFLSVHKGLNWDKKSYIAKSLQPIGPVFDHTIVTVDPPSTLEEKTLTLTKSLNFDKSSRTVKVMKKDVKRFFCAHCPKGFTRAFALLRHILSVHKGIKLDEKKPYICAHCGKAFRFSSKLQTHLSTHTKLHCYHCQETFSSRATIQKHILSVHIVLLKHKSIKSDEKKPCGKAFKFPSEVRTYSSVHNKLHCYYCLETFTSRVKIHKHIWSVHKGHNLDDNLTDTVQSNVEDMKKIKPFYHKNHFCPYCQKIFPTPSGLKKHILPVHKGIKKEKLFMCEECGKAFSSTSNLKKHSTVHFKGTPLACELCSKRFKLRSGLRNHIKKMHTVRTGVFKCEQCPIIRQTLYRCPKKFGDHQKLHDPSTACVCLKCEKSLASFNDLTDHIQIHHKATPNSLDVKCEKCNKKYITPVGLRVHLFSDHFSKLFTCDFCEFSSTQKPSLQRHLWIHKESCPFPFMCTEENCGFRTRHKTYFREHLSKTHNISYDSRLHDMDEEQLTALMKEQEKIGLKPYLSKYPLKKINTTQAWKCTQCPQTFSHSGNLSRHVNILHKNMNYECKFCDCHYNSPLGLWKHSFKHRDGIKPFNCPNCEYKSTIKTLFKKHLVKRHEITYDEQKHGYKVPMKEVLEFAQKKRDSKDDAQLYSFMLS